MGRVIAAELPSLPTRLIDLDDDHHGAQLVDELRAPDTEVALRAGHRFVPRLVPAAAPESTVQLRDTATYLVTGGAGGLGSLVARRFVEAGAGCVVLCGRRSDPPPDITAWLAGEPRARYVAVDVADRAAVARLIHELSSTTRPVAGVVHAAGILKDATLEQLTPSDLAAVMAPKRDGLWNLHAETAELPLDFFVAFSSATALVGSPGQANYAAANAYVDQLCWVRRAEGKPALTINWGPWAEVGLAAAEHRGRRLAALGVRSITPEAGVSCLMALLGRGEQGQVVVLPLDRDKLRASHAMASSPVLAEILAVAPVGAAAAAASPDRPAPAQLESFLRDQLAAVLRRPAAEVDVETPFPELGLESLEVLRFKNCLELALGVVLPATVVWKHPTIRALAKRLEHEMGNAPTRSR
jgi:NADP-dependent 3-hydroxy acid dehydrogenase YdfG/acyl carrier protein